MFISCTLYTKIVQIKNISNLSLIPLNGKKPLFAWKTWQKRLASEAQLKIWLNNSITKSYGILLGKISGDLAVIDFDSNQQYLKFQKNFPVIAETYTVKTKRGVHVYLHTNSTTYGYRFKGGDFLAEGSYVVGPESIVDGHTYTIKNDTKIQTITQKQQNKINRWLTQKKNKPASGHISTHKKLNVKKRYIKQAKKGSRNKALYQTATQAKQNKISQERVIYKLADQHARMPARWIHAPETYETRYQEALRTIESAYKSRLTSKGTTQGLVANGLREKLLEVYQSATTGRVLEAFLKEGWQAGRTFSLKDTQQLGEKYNIGNNAIRQCIYNKKIYKKVPPVGDSTKREQKAETLGCGDSLDQPKLSTKKAQGRAPQFFIFPALSDLYQTFEVEPLASDCLSAEDLSSNSRYQMALHRELIRRMKPEYPIAWHAQRLQVSESTIRRYNQALAVVSTPIFEYQSLTMENVDDPDLWECEVRCNYQGRQVTPGQWIQRNDGKRFPAIKGVALDWMSRDNMSFIMCYRRPARLEIPNETSTVYKVIWQCKENTYMPEWGGGAYDFPPLVKPAIPYHQPVAAMPEPPIPQQPLAMIGELPPEALSAQQQLGMTTYTHLNESLALIKGLGGSRVMQLQGAGIQSLEDLILAGEEQLFHGIHWRGREYLSIATCKRWVDQAQVLLGWKAPDPLLVQQEQQRQLAQDRKKDVQKFMRYLNRIQLWEHAVFGTGQVEETSWATLSKWFTHDILGNPHKLFQSSIQQKIDQRMQQFTLRYLERTRVFLEKLDDELERYSFGDRKTWKALHRQTLRYATSYKKAPILIESSKNQRLSSKLGGVK